jgi:hypothetical protein
LMIFVLDVFNNSKYIGIWQWSLCDLRYKNECMNWDIFWSVLLPVAVGI